MLSRSGRDLGVRYVLEGSVRRANDRVRINVQLLDATTGGHVWAERYDGEMRDIFALQDQVTQQIVQALHITLTADEQTRLVQRSTDNLQAYDFVLRGESYLWRTTQESLVQARRLFEQAIALDAQYAAAYAWLGWADFFGFIMQWEQDPQVSQRAHALVQRAVGPWTTRYPSRIGYWAISICSRSSMSGRSASLSGRWLSARTMRTIMPGSGSALTFVGRPQEALRLIQQAIRLNPRYPFIYLHFLGHTYRVLGQTEESIAVLKRALAHNPDFLPAYYNLLLASVDLGRLEEARALATEILRLSPDFSFTTMTQALPYKDPADLERILAAFREAGLEENVSD